MRAASDTPMANTAYEDQSLPQQEDHNDPEELFKAAYHASTDLRIGNGRCLRNPERY